jgi:hypothetical protein
MAQYELTLQFSTQDIMTILETGQKVTLIKSVGATGGTTSDVAWVAFNPFESNSVTWMDEYGIYASTVQVINGAQVNKISDIEAAEEEAVTFQDSGIFSAPVQDSSLTSGQYKAINQYDTLSLLTFGMEQGVAVNGQSQPAQPINAVSVPKTDNVVFTPFEKVIAFLAAGIDSSSIVAQITSPSTAFTFGGGVDSITAIYYSPTGEFHQI